MGKVFTTIGITKECKTLLVHARAIYRNEHPELDQIPLSNNKILYEVLEYYKKTYAKNYDIELGKR